jgi:hypothetical protein
MVTGLGRSVGAGADLVVLWSPGTASSGAVRAIVTKFCMTGRRVVVEGMVARRIIAEGLTGRRSVVETMTGLRQVAEAMTGRRQTSEALTGRIREDC